jgi:hypothetical protein
MSNCHSSVRTVAEWVSWAHHEGFVDVSECNPLGTEIAGMILVLGTNTFLQLK